MLKLKFNSYFVTAQLQLVLHAENWSERKFRELQEHLLHGIWPLLFSRFSWICHFRSRKFDVLPLQWCQACYQSQISEQDIRNRVFQIIWQVRVQHFAINRKMLHSNEYPGRNIAVKCVENLPRQWPIWIWVLVSQWNCSVTWHYQRTLQ